MFLLQNLIHSEHSQRKYNQIGKVRTDKEISRSKTYIALHQLIFQAHPAEKHRLFAHVFVVWYHLFPHFFVIYSDNSWYDMQIYYYKKRGHQLTASYVCIK